MDEKKDKKGLVLEIILLVLGAALLLGSKLVFHACEAMDNGMYMNCHKAENAAAIFGAGIAALSLLLIFIKPRGVKIALAAVIAAGSVVSAIIPNNVIKLCMMSDMRCRSVMQPAVIVFGAVTALVAVVYIILKIKKA